MKRFVRPSFSLLLSALLLTGGGPRPVHAKDVAAVVTQIVGALYVRETGATSFRKAKKGEFVYEGTTLKTGKGDRAALSFVNGIEIKINENTTYLLRPTRPAKRGQGNDTTLAQGRMWFKVLRKGTKFDIKTPVAAVSVRGTEGDVDFQNQNMRATCYAGEFRVIGLPGGGRGAGADDVDMEPDYDENQGVGVSAGQLAVVTGDKPPEVRTLDKKDTWHEELSSGGKGVLKLAASVGEVEKGKAVRITLEAYDSGGHADPNFEGEVVIYADRDDVELSPTGQSAWTRRTIRARALDGAAEFFARAENPGFVNVNAQADGYESTPARFSIARPSQREAEVEIEMEKGERKKLRLKFRR